MKKALVVLAVVVGLMAGGAGVAQGLIKQRVRADMKLDPLQSNLCVGAAVTIDDPNIIPGPGSATGLAIYLPAVQSTRQPAPIGFGELPPNPCDQASHPGHSNLARVILDSS